MQNNVHIPVLLHETVDGLALKDGDVVIDATVNGGGHSEEIARKFGAKVRIVGIDLDADALVRSDAKLKAAGARYDLVNDSYVNMEQVLRGRGITHANAVLFDFGLSSDQYESGRGFSFQKDEPLLMTFAREGALLTARDIVNDWEESSLEAIIKGFGEERYARSIAKSIVLARELETIERTGQLVEAILAGTPKRYHHGRIHPATRTFQAIRMAVNGELDAVAKGLAAAVDILAPGGRIVAISFHSLEDRIVKRYFKEVAAEREGAKIITKKPMTPSEEEAKTNPRSRSAKLRILQV